MATNRENAKNLLLHYFELSAGHIDEPAEVEGIVDAIIDAAKAEIMTELKPKLRELRLKANGFIVED